MKGIGTRARTFFGRGPAEAFGIGGHRRVRQAIERLENNLDAGDGIVDVVGFSRGAALAMSFANEIESKLPGVEIRFVGVFDLVAQFGCRAITSTPATSCRCPITSSAAAMRWRWTSRGSCFPLPGSAPRTVATTTASSKRGSAAFTPISAAATATAA